MRLNLLPAADDVMSVHYLTLGNTVESPELPIAVPESQRYRLKTLDKGFPFIPLKAVERDGRDANPATVEKWSNASFQDRHIAHFEHEGKPYLVIVAVDGVWMRNKHWTMLDRAGKGGTRNPLLGKHMATSVGDHCGLHICTKGVRIANFTKLLDMPAMAEYNVLTSSKSRPHILILLVGDVQPTMDRTQLSKNAQDTLQSAQFLARLKGTLDALRARRGVFAKFMQRVQDRNCEERTAASIQ